MIIAVIVGFLSIHSTIAFNYGKIYIQLFQPYFNKNSFKPTNKRTSTLNMALETPDKITISNNEKLIEKAPEFSSLRNLKTVPVKEDEALLGRWNELKGLSEKELIIAASRNILKAERTEIALGLAYKRCEYVTQLFSKTFYMGTSLMRPDARAHVSLHSNIYVYIYMYYVYIYMYTYINIYRSMCANMIFVFLYMIVDGCICVSNIYLYILYIHMHISL
jgi:hypothetical protein